MSLLLLLNQEPLEEIDLSAMSDQMVRELALNIRNTQVFIAADPSSILFKRDARTSDGAGGKIVLNSTSVAAAIVRMVPQGADNATSNPITQTTNGSLDRPDFVMVGEPGLPLQRDDYFDWRGKTWKILSVRTSPAYETKADIAVRKDV